MHSMLLSVPRHEVTKAFCLRRRREWPIRPATRSRRVQSMLWTCYACDSQVFILAVVIAELRERYIQGIKKRVLVVLVRAVSWHVARLTKLYTTRISLTDICLAKALQAEISTCSSTSRSAKDFDGDD